MRNLSAVVIAIFGFAFVAEANDRVHLVMLTGDDRMLNLDEHESFVPLLKSGLADDDLVVVKAAYQRAHLGHWHNDWVGEFRGREVRDSSQGWILHELIQKGRAAAGQSEIQSVTLVWAQGAADAREGFSAAYDQSFCAMTEQLAEELGRDDVNCVIARLGVVDDRPERYPEWDAVRTIQEKLGDSLRNACWVDTDKAVNKSKDYSDLLGRLLADATLKQIRGKNAVEIAPLAARKSSKEQAPAHLFLLSGQSN
ncbi:MAG: sialate O-acetylesterase, partial [Verrucomicrobiota bacterium]